MNTPFLVRGKTQPVRWRSWGEEAFAEARHTIRPVFLLVGASWCRTSALLDRDLVDPEIARRLNDLFIPIRVDRDARPDIDARYQALGHAATKQSGWPLAAFLDGQGRLFHSGTRFSKTPSGGRTALGAVLDQTAAYFQERRDKTEAYAQKLLDGCFPKNTPADGDPETRRRPARGADIAPLASAFDARHGGFGGAPKFPLPLAIEALLVRARNAQDRAAEEMARKTLTRLAASPLHDPVGGGFHRMSQDEAWREPAYEKLLADNAELLRLFCLGYAILKDPLLLTPARGIVRFLEETLHLEGTPCFAASVAAGDALEEGDFYRWPAAQLNRLLTAPERQVLAETAGWKRAGDRILTRLATVEIKNPAGDVARALRLSPLEIARHWEKGLEKLAEGRKERAPLPHDATLYSAANAEVARAFLAAAPALARPDLREAALAILDRILAEAATDGLVGHALGEAPLPFFAADQAHVGLACLEAFQDAGASRYIEAARRLADGLTRRFRVPGRGFHDVLLDDADLITQAMPLFDVIDLPGPSANGLAALFMARLGKTLGNEGAPYRRNAQEALESLSGASTLYGPYAAGICLAEWEAADTIPSRRGELPRRIARP